MILSGFMGSGKTAVGAALAEILGWQFVDLDREVERLAGSSIETIFARVGESGFRALEGQALGRILASRGDEEAAAAGVVLALGGGTLETAEARGHLRDKGPVVYLDVEPGTAWSRVVGTGRPLARDRKQFEELLEARRPRYLEAADWVVPSNSRDVQRLASEIGDVVVGLSEAWPTSWGRLLERTARRSLVVGGEGALRYLGHRAAQSAARGSRFFVVTDENVASLWEAEVTSLLRAGGVEEGDAGRVRTLIVPPGEPTKSVGELARCWEWLAANGCRRDDVVVAFGGGVIGDLAGFAAATYHRGVALWQVPTTLLAQVDSGVGGKTAVNLSAGKNLVGAFYQPDLVVIDPRFLSTLSEAEYRSGLGEVVKYGLLVGPSLLDRLEADVDGLRARDPAVLAEVVKRCVHYKAEVVERDERDTDLRAVLNLGHTTGHALESSLGYGTITHGQAVSLGLLVALRVSELRLGLPADLLPRTRALLEALGLATKLPLPSREAILTAVGRDKKVSAESAGFVGLRMPGAPVTGLDVSAAELREALEVITGGGGDHP